MEIYERYASLFLHSNATFLCERAHAEVRTAASLEALASCYLRQGAAKRAYAVLCGCASSANGRYLLAVACYKLDKLAEAETALLPDRAARAAGPKASRDLLLGPGSPVPHGAAGLHLLGVVCQHTHRRDHAVEYYRLALRLDALMWVSFDALCQLGASVDADAAFDDHAPHALRDRPAKRLRGQLSVVAGRGRRRRRRPRARSRRGRSTWARRTSAAPAARIPSSRARSRRSTRRTPWPTRPRRRRRSPRRPSPRR